MTQTLYPRQPLGSIPAEIHLAEDYEALASHFMSPEVFAYLAGGSGHETTLRANRAAFEQAFLLPRALRSLIGANTACTLLGRLRPHPILLAPVAFQTLVHPAGEVETVWGADVMATPMVLSTLSSCTLEQVAEASATRSPWFQLYVQPDRAVTLDLIKRAELAGYEALVVTVDAGIKQAGLRALRAGFRFPDEVQAANLSGYPLPPAVTLAEGDSRVFHLARCETPTWDDLAWLQRQTRLPVLVKGILHPGDALRLRDMGFAGVIVSNHGGRALDGVPASLRQLPEIRRQVGAEFTLLLDSGIRSGQDIFRAMALGANGVLIGRLQVYALAVAGALGVAHLLRTLCEELELCMAQAGCASLEAITADFLIDSD